MRQVRAEAGRREAALLQHVCWSLLGPVIPICRCVPGITATHRPATIPTAGDA